MPNVSQIYDTNSGIWRDVADAQARKNILYYNDQNVNVNTNAQIIRIPASGTDSKITTNTVLLRCDFASSPSVHAVYNWQSFNGYFVITGTCTSATTANVTLGQKGN